MEKSGLDSTEAYLTLIVPAHGAGALEFQQMVVNLKIKLLGQLLSQHVYSAVIKFNGGPALGANEVMVSPRRRYKPLGGVI